MVVWLESCDDREKAIERGNLVTIERWTDARLDKLADGVEKLIEQLHQVSDQISDQITQNGSRIERTCERVDAFIEGKHDDERSSSASVEPAHLLDRLTVLESQMQQLMQRVQYLERREVSQLAIQVQPGIMAEETESNDIDDDVEDEPDEILWDFFDPSERQK